ncbi:DUF4148 domain-containing protein [Variovorax paradoxus]|uniref:DUF4148 domain-containing protein n=1 Tax=Variovorax paradoxus TaxID=34073 RepID=A0A679J142_VARPD|nr:hypothetical protein VVAX_04019 [Variovorax paradoxus]
MKKLNAAMAALAASLLLSAGAASAQGLSRAEVVAQLKAAQASGQLAALTGEDSGSAYLAQHFHPSETRTEVKTELAQARADGTLGVLASTDSGSAYLSRHFMSSEPRAEVKAELASAEKSGHFDALYGEDSGSFYLAHGGRTAGAGSAMAMAGARTGGQ